VFDNTLRRRQNIYDRYLEENVSGAFGEVETPDPIPNSAVKRFSADGSRKARVGRCREHSSSASKNIKAAFMRLFFFLL
jgi:hypothetical protein